MCEHINENIILNKHSHNITKRQIRRQVRRNKIGSDVENLINIQKLKNINDNTNSISLDENFQSMRRLHEKWGFIYGLRIFWNSSAVMV